MVLHICPGLRCLDWTGADARTLGLFYGGYGVLMFPTLNIAQPYGGTGTPHYNNAFGFYILSESPQTMNRIHQTLTKV